MDVIQYPNSKSFLAMDATAAKGELILHLAKSRYRKLSSILVNILLIVLFVQLCHPDISEADTSWLLVDSFLIIAMVTFHFLALEPGIFTTIPLYKDGLRITRIFSKPVWLAISELGKIRSFRTWGNRRPGFVIESTSYPAMNIMHQFRRKQLIPLYQYFVEHGVNVYKHYL